MRGRESRLRADHKLTSARRDETPTGPTGDSDDIYRGQKCELGFILEQIKVSLCLFSTCFLSQVPNATSLESDLLLSAACLCLCLCV